MMELRTFLFVERGEENMRVATDIGGTFTDLVYVDDNGKIGTAKSSTTPDSYEQGVLNVIKESGVDQVDIDTFIHGTTVVINTLTERKGTTVGLITTKGFRDVLEIARGNRPDLFNIHYIKPEPFVERYLRREVTERLNYKGEVLTPLAIHEVDEIVSYFKKNGVKAIAISLIHSYENPTHEEKIAERIKELWPEVAISISSEITKEFREYERTNTTVLNAYVKPIANTYINSLESSLDAQANIDKKFVMKSNGGTASFDQAKQQPIQLIESGPVAGIYGSAYLGELIDEKNIIAFDIGGTTAKCSLIENGEMTVDTDYHIEKTERHAGYPVKIPVVDIVEIGNGGGSIAWLDPAGALKVGPQSAGAYPGPVAYNQGGTEPTTTDAQLLTGRLSAKNIDYDVDLDKVRAAIKEHVADHFDISPEEAALGIIQIADSNMINALKLISTRRGHNPEDFAMVAFGGGGSMHAPTLARELGIKKVIVPQASPVFASWGMLMSDLRNDYVQTYVRPFNTVDFSEINGIWSNLETKALETYQIDGIAEDQVKFQRYLDMRYAGQEHTVKVPVPNHDWSEADRAEIISRFAKLHEKTYTFALEDTATEVVGVHLAAFGHVDKPTLEKTKITTDLKEALKENRPVYFAHEGWVETDIYDRHLLPTDQVIQGPVIIEEKAAVTVVHQGQSVHKDEYGNLIVLTKGEK